MQAPVSQAGLGYKQPQRWPLSLELAPFQAVWRFSSPVWTCLGRHGCIGSALPCTTFPVTSVPFSLPPSLITCLIFIFFWSQHCRAWPAPSPVQSLLHNPKYLLLDLSNTAAFPAKEIKETIIKRILGETHNQLPLMRKICLTCCLQHPQWKVLWTISLMTSRRTLPAKCLVFVTRLCLRKGFLWH